MMCKKHLSWPLLISLLGLLLQIAGCASKPRLLPDGGPTTKEVYEGHLADGYNQDDAASVEFSEHHAAAWEPRYESRWMRTTQNEMSLKFPRIPNIEMQGYVYAHPSPKGHPVPGYSVTFPLYETIHYALPGEVVPKMPSITPGVGRGD